MNKSVHALRHAVLSGLAVLLLAACNATSPPVSYYSLLGTEVPTVAAERHEQLVLSVGPVIIPDLLKQSQIATGGTEGRYQISDIHRWTGELDKEIARAVAEQLAARLGTQKVVVFPWEQNLEATLRVMIDVLAMGGEPGKEAILSVRWTLVDPQGKVPSLVRRSDLREVPATAGYPAWVTAQQRNLVSLGAEISRGLLSALPK